MHKNATGSAGCSVAPGLIDVLMSSASRVDHIASEIEHLHRLALLGVLSAGLAHEINNILTPVIAYSHAALSQNSDDRLCVKALRRALRGAEDVAAIVHGTLGIAMKSDDEISRAEVAEAFFAARASLGRDPSRDGVTIAHDFTDGVIARISPIALRQVFMNLLLNAQNAMEGRVGRIDVAAECHHDRVNITVEDNGPGIPAEDCERIFEPFVTASSSGNYKKSTGTGLGLSVCRMLIEGAGGTISLRSKLAKGTTFLIDLPAASTSAREAA